MPVPPSLQLDAPVAALFRQYAPMVYKTALLLLDSAQDAEDAVQEVFVQVYRHRPTYDPKRAALSTWIYRITVNLCISRRRKAAWRHWIVARWGGNTADAHAASPEAGLEDVEVRLALQQLNDKLRTVLVLRFYNDLTYEQIAEILEIPVGTAKSRVHLALRTLRDHLMIDTREKRVAPLQELLP